MTLLATLRWASDAALGEYLITWDESSLTDEEDLGNRAGFSDEDLARIREELAPRGLTLATDDRGILTDWLDEDLS